MTSYRRHTHNRSQRFGGHTKHQFYCSCGKVVTGNGGKRHFELEGHARILQRQWAERFGTPEAAKPLTPETACKPAGGGTDG